MLSLTHSSATQFAWNGKIYDIDLAFDTVLLYLQLQEDSSLSPFDKWRQSCKLFLHKNSDLPNDADFYEKVFQQLQKIIADTPYGTTVKKDNGGVEATKQFDYVRDAGAIYASFFDQYGIDLNKERGKMHWDTFKALFDGLGPKTYFQRILNIRNEDPSKIDDPVARQELCDAQNYYAVDGTKSNDELQEQAFNSDIASNVFNALLNKAKKGGS